MMRLLAALLTGLCLCCGAASAACVVGFTQCLPVTLYDGNGNAVSPGGGGSAGSVTITSSEIPIPAATSTQLLAANTSRKFLSATNDGTTPCRVSYGVAATNNNGEPLAGAATANGQGGARTFDASAIPQQAIYAYCAAGGSFAVLEGQ